MSSETEETLVAEIVNLIGCYLNRCGYQPWIMEAINEAIENVERLIEEKEQAELVRLQRPSFS
jgi:hypothetical protein